MVKHIDILLIKPLFLNIKYKIFTVNIPILKKKESKQNGGGERKGTYLVIKKLKNFTLSKIDSDGSG